MKFKIKITLNFDEGGYMVFVDGIPELVGYGDTEIKAIIDFFNNYDKFKNHEYFEPILIKNLKEKFELLNEDL